MFTYVWLYVYVMSGCATDSLKLSLTTRQHRLCTTRLTRQMYNDTVAVSSALVTSFIFDIDMEGSSLYPQYKHRYEV